jgi:hypothetical protein
VLGIAAGEKAGEWYQGQRRPPHHGGTLELRRLERPHIAMVGISLPNLAQKHRADSSGSLDPSGGDGPHMLALRRRPRLETIQFVGVDDHLGATLANAAGLGHDMNHVRPAVHDSSRRHPASASSHAVSS